ncbi:hypothetical protein MNAN1_001701 [Malassezia nana]|uniref:RPA43 OB domain-containing protein n=1 Tax=Malassezia nana TaxID=180528 RepID=A0AAF0EQ41_9BASI|nr:hypothetical protein MNAN1_001701 [Malassezia nana]
MGKKNAAQDLASRQAASSTGLVKMQAKMHFLIPPAWTMDPMSSVLEQLDTLVMRYIPQLEGVLIAHSHVKFLRALGDIDGNSASAEAPVKFTALVWRPEIGMALEGTINLSLPSHVSLLLYGTFNAAISSAHLPASEWEFVHYSDAGEGQQRSFTDRSIGFWRHKTTRQRLGNDDGRLTFSVISMTVAHQMLSLHGSLLEDPFSVPPPRPGSLSFEQSLSTTEPMEEVQEEPVPAPRRVRWEDDSDEEVTEVQDDGEDNDEDENDYMQTSDAAEDEADEDSYQVSQTWTEPTEDAEDEESIAKSDKKAKKEKKAKKKDKKEKSHKKDKEEKKSKKEKTSSGKKRSRDEDTSAKKQARV